ncbi:MAG: FAD-dependent oxidoreductase [Bdellovibrio sp.]
MQRRDFLKNAIYTAALSSVSTKSLAKGSTWVANNLTDKWPIARLSDDENSSVDFNGDNINRPHDILWNIDGYIAGKGGEPKVSEELDAVIVGGGVAGISAAYYLRDKKIALLEQDRRLGGNSKGELYKDVCYSIGAAYLCEPAPSSIVGQLLTDLNIFDKARRESSDDTSVFFNRKFTTPFWSGASASSSKQDFIKFHSRLKEIYHEADFSNGSSFATEHDDMSAEEWLHKEFGEIHPHIKEYMQLYGWSSFCGSIDELSAFQYLGFISSETANLMAFPGGNSFIVHRMAQRIGKSAGGNSLRSDCMVLRVQSEGGSATVLYEDGFGTLKKIRAKHVVMACQKFVAKRLIPEMNAVQTNAIDNLTYRAYVVANILTRQPIQSPSYELYSLQGKVPQSPSAMNKGDRSFTDICFGSWAQQDQTQHGVLTLYHGLPFDGARQFLFNPASHDKYKNYYLKDIEPVLNALNLSEGDIHGVRLTRWGHSLPLSRTGLINSGYPQLASTTIENCIHFANQDNWMNPCFETAHQAALDVIKAIR